MKTCIIYCLINPINNNIFYIGQTVNNLNQRLSRHLSIYNYNAVNNKIFKKIKDKNLVPIIKELVTVNGNEEIFDYLESFTIDLCNKHHIATTNIYNLNIYKYDTKIGLNPDVILKKIELKKQLIKHIISNPNYSITNYDKCRSYLNNYLNNIEKKRIYALREYSKHLKDETQERIYNSIEELSMLNKKITTTQIAKLLNLNRTTIYNHFKVNPTLKEIIDNHNNNLK